jgi:hypothetical protein
VVAPECRAAAVAWRDGQELKPDQGFARVFERVDECAFERVVDGP